jgi:ornithine carbamoyltransferase
MFSICALRVRDHQVFARMLEATKGSMSFINLLSDAAHPTQAVADVLTIAEHFAHGDVKKLSGLEVAYVGDATNVTRSLCVALLRLGVNVTVSAPEGYQLVLGGGEDPFSESTPGVLTLTDSPHDGVKNADVIYTDAWVSMGLEDETFLRRQIFAPYRVDEQLVSAAKADAVVMHCLPAHRGDEITSDVLDSANALVWRQVFHRRSAMLGVLRWIKKEDRD